MVLIEISNLTHSVRTMCSGGVLMDNMVQSTPPPCCLWLSSARFTERGVAGSDPSTRGRDPVVLKVRFRSRAFSIAEIQSEIVLGYLHYLDFCTV